MICPRCQAENPDGKSYCSDCGVALTLASPVDPPVVELETQIQAALDERLKDQKYVEIEIAQRVSERLLNWLKLLGTVTSIPLAILAIILGLLGITKIADFFAYVEKAKTNMEASVAEAQKNFGKQTEGMEHQVKAAKKNAEALESEYESITGEIRRLREKLSESEKDLSGKIGHLQGAVEQLQRTEFEKSTDMTPEIQRKLDSDISQFRSYMQKAGFVPKKDLIKVKVDPAAMSNAYFDVALNTIMVGPDLAAIGDSDVAFREYSDHVLMKEEETPGYVANGIESGLADYFACSFKDDPRFGAKAVRLFKKMAPGQFTKPYLRTLDNRLRFDELHLDGEGRDVLREGEVWGGAFWDLRQKLGMDAQERHLADVLLLKTWENRGPLPKEDNAARAAFVQAILAQDQKLTGGKFTSSIREVFQSRGLKL